ncbi:MAG: outer membrane protein assembly factor BamD [Sphingobacteriales bacterium]|nr:MAG: outer membrane protein assembly factor BamD [Sphingobacteriales bacterium]
MYLKHIQLLFLSFCIALLSACGGVEQVRKSNDINYKLTKANEYYDKKKYQQANQLYFDLLPVMKNTKNYEPLYYRYAYSFWYMKDYTSASYHFKNFTDFFPASKEADEVEYMTALALYKLSPKPSLDPTNTMKAMEAMQSYINTHPNAKQLDEANRIVDECRKKLEEKDADAAKLYYNISQYKAACIAYKSVLRNYPESPKSDYYQFMIVRAWYLYAQQSLESKQEERYAASLNAYQELVDGFPKSQYLREAEKYYTLADSKIKKIRNEHK